MKVNVLLVWAAVLVGCMSCRTGGGGDEPLLGVCLGMQFTNVVAGGSLIQDIPSQIGPKVNHRAYHSVHARRARRR